MFKNMSNSRLVGYNCRLCLKKEVKKMAIIPKDRYPDGTISTDVANYPYGKAKDVSTPGGVDGVPWEDALVNDIWGFFQAMLKDTAITPSSNPETAIASQYLDAIKRYTIASQTIAQTKNNALTPASVIDIEPCYILDSTKTKIIPITTTISKDLSATWVAGVTDGGRAAVVPYNIDTWYHEFAIMTDDGIVSAYYDTSPTAANRPVGYNIFKRTGSYYNKSNNNIAPFVQNNRIFAYKDPSFTYDFTAAPLPANTQVYKTVYSPLGIKTAAQIKFSIDTIDPVGAVYFTVESPDINDYDIVSSKARTGMSTTVNIDFDAYIFTGVITDSISRVWVKVNISDYEGHGLTTHGYEDITL